MSTAPIGRIEPATIPLQSADTTVGIAAAIVLALTVFVGVMVYLAFGPHNTVLQDDETPIGRVTASKPDTAESDAEAVQGQPADGTTEEDATGGESDGASST
ncbi:hypothetical protein [Halopiger thermotolerans]